MDAKALKTPPKITVRIWRPVLDKLEQTLDAACLRRDAYLSRLLESETPLLESEVSLSNSEAAHAYLLQSLDRLDRKPVSLALRPALVESLNAVCLRKRIPRDSFFNRLFLLLAAGPKLLDDLFFPDAGEWKREVWRRYQSDASAWQAEFYPLHGGASPFWALRAGIEIYAEDSEVEDYADPATGIVVSLVRNTSGAVEPIDSLYTRAFDRKFQNGDLTGLNCYLPDWKVPGNPSQQDRPRALDDILLAEI